MTTAEEASTILVRRVEDWTVGLGATASLAAWYRWGWRAGAGVAVGTLLSWMNYRWLKGGVIALAAAATEQEGAEKVRVPAIIKLKFFGRFVLLLFAAYVILTGLKWPAASVLSGLFAVIAGILAESVAHLFRSLTDA